MLLSHINRTFEYITFLNTSLRSIFTYKYYYRSNILFSKPLIQPFQLNLPFIKMAAFSTKSTLISYLGQIEAQELDKDLMSPDIGFCIENLMELAGLSVAEVTAFIHNNPELIYKPILIVCGPGNNGGDGLVAARHLTLFGYNVEVFYPKQTSKQLFRNLVQQCNGFNIPFLNELPESLDKYACIVDALFGFSFSGKVRSPFDQIISKINNSGINVISVDIPSGWNVETGHPLDDISINAHFLISLTAPKLCARYFKGRHFLGGRFVPYPIIDKYNLILPKYQGANQFTEL